MALYSFSARVFRRGEGHSALKKAAYRAGEKLRDVQAAQTYDYSRSKDDVVHSEILAPEGAPSWATNREALWNRVELRADQSPRADTAVLARELRMALPRELSRDGQIDLVRAFLQEEFVTARRVVVDWAVHDPQGRNQPHVHAMITVRSLGPEGFGNKIREWDHRKWLRHWREQWGVHVNHALEREGHEERVDHRSYAEQGIDLAPQPKLYRRLEEAEGDGREHVQEQLEAHRRVARENGERILQDPTIPLRMLTNQRATFRKEDLYKILNTHTLDAEQFSTCLHAVMSSPEFVKLPSGRFTSQEMLSAEKRLLDAGDALVIGMKHDVRDQFVQQAAAARPTITDEQRRALEYLTRTSGDIAVLEGHAGTGKSFLLGAAREAWEAQGFTVVGGALAGKAAEGLSLSSGIEARTLASWERSWCLDREQLTSQHVLVIDEAGMLGTRQLGRMLEKAREAGAKVVLVGDSRQLQAIEAGSPFRVLAERLGSELLSQVMRQRLEWQREATMAFARGNAKQALEAYHAHHHVRAHLTTEKARASVVKAWAKGLESTPLHEQLIFAYRRDDVRALNELAREVRRHAGELGTDHLVMTENGTRAFARGDRLYFGRNDRLLGVMNGTLGIVEGIEGNQMTVRLDGATQKRITVDLQAYQHLDHGYAVTVHKSQGATVDRVYVMASKLFDASASYVAMSRQRDHVELHWARDEFGTRAELDRILSRERPKELAHEQLENIEQITLKDALADDSRFALLSPHAQCALIAQYERTQTELLEKHASKNAHEELHKLPELVAAKEHEKSMLKQLASAQNALSDYQMAKARLRWFETMKKPERPYAEAVERARATYDEAKKHRKKLEHDPALHERARRIASEHNLRRAAHQERLSRWRTLRLDVERAGLREHAVERLSQKLGHAVRWASEADQGRVYEVRGAVKFRVRLSDGSEPHLAILKAPDGSSMITEVRDYEAKTLKRGMSVALRGRELSIRSADRGLGR